ncbi:MAG: DUF2004 domain-containing protein [Polyangiaceae bacterium]
MTQLKHEHLGTFDPTQSGYSEGTRRFAERDVRLDLTIEKAGLSVETVQALLSQLDRLEELDRVARSALQLQADEDEDDEGAVMLYVDHHLEELDDEALASLFAPRARDDLDVEAVLAKLALVRVGLYPDDSDDALLLDYSLSEDLTNYILCVRFDAEGQLRGIDLES